MKRVYLLIHGDYGSEGYIDRIFQFKKEAIAYIKSRKDKYVKRRRYECDEVSKWYRINSYMLIETKKKQNRYYCEMEPSENGSQYISKDNTK